MRKILILIPFLLSGCGALKAGFNPPNPPTFSERCHAMVHATCNYIDRCSKDEDVNYRACIIYTMANGDPCDRMIFIGGPLEECVRQTENLSCDAVGTPAICEEVVIQ
jgi:hypothetical protein